METKKLEASFSALVLSIGSSAAMAMGLAPDPVSGKSEKDINIARFNIDMLVILQEKTKNNLATEDHQFLDKMINDLQMKFLQLK